jgi:hypothetical protein
MWHGRAIRIGREMPKYFPIQGPIDIKCSLSNMTALQWRMPLETQLASLVADFVIPGHDLGVLRVQCDRVHIIRVLDEMPLSTEAEETPNEGLVADHFAYTVEGSAFWLTQSAAFKTVFQGARHYRFITGWTCLDVIAERPPFITVAPVEGAPP